MSDRRRTTTKKANAYVASARVLGAAHRGSIPRPQSWQEEAWGYYDSVGEVRFASSWYGNALSRARLALAHKGKGGETPTLLDPDDPRNDLLEELIGGEAGQSQLLGGFAPHLVIPGIGYMVGTDDPVTSARTWKVLSYDEIRSQNDVYEILDGPKSWQPLPSDSLPVQVWRPHARFHYQPDSPLRPLLPVLRELSLLSAHVDATATSRLAGAGVFAIPSEATFPVSEQNKDADDPFLAEFMEAMLTPIGDRDAASAVVPLLMRVPGEYLDKLQHLTFSTPFDDKSLSLREEAIRRFANGMDMPAEVLLGMASSNHWTAWQIEEGAVKLHVVPMLETIAQGVTVGAWRPLTQTLALGGAPVKEADDLIVWYDVSGLVVRPDRSGDAKDLWDRQVLGTSALLRECGFGDGDLPTPDETRRAVILDIIKGAPTLAPVLLPVIGISLDVPAGAEPLDATGTEVVPAIGDGATPPVDGPVDGPPARPAQTDAPTGDTVTASVAEAGLLAACDALVWRALEHAGNRLRNAARGQGTDLSHAPPEAAHLEVDATCLSDLDRLLGGAWERLPAIADRYGADLDATRRVLDVYTRSILAAQVPHSFDKLSAAFTGE